jgi:hypothetical protein
MFISTISRSQKLVLVQKTKSYFPIVTVLILKWRIVLFPKEAEYKLSLLFQSLPYQIVKYKLIIFKKEFGIFVSIPQQK